MKDNLTNKGNLTNDEIIKALEYCQQQGITSECERCRVKSGCRATLVENALDLINRQKAEIEQWKDEANKYQSLWASACNEAKSDVVEVVRCKDCIHSTESPMRIICQKYWRDVNEDGYCIYGKRKDE